MKQEQGFVAGTLVHTDKGLVPIEQIKVGDIVLSKPESGEGELAYKPVVNTLEFDDKEVWYVEFRSSLCYPYERMDSGEIPYHNEFIIGTPNHPFWVVGEREETLDFYILGIPKITFYPVPHWRKLEQLTPNTVVLLVNGFLSTVANIQPVFVMSDPDLGFLQGYPSGYWWDAESGSFINLKGTPTLHSQEFDTFFNKDMRFFSRDSEWDYPVKTRKVYNFEVADYHTYFVGEGGIWVKSN